MRRNLTSNDEEKDPNYVDIYTQFYLTVYKTYHL